MKIKQFANELEALLRIREARKLTGHGFVDDYLISAEEQLIQYLKDEEVNYDD